MKITFIRPHMTSRRAADALEPLVFGILTRLTPPDVELVLYDDRIEPIPYDEPTDLVAMTVETFTAKRAYQISAEYKQRGVLVVMGGYHPTLLPDEVSQYADAVAVGDAEEIWPRIVEDARTRKLQPIYKAPAELTVAGVNPDRKIFANKKYRPLHLVQVGRGCKFACDFCSIHAFYGRSMPRRCLEDVMTEMDELRGKYVFFADDNLFTNIEQAEALFKALIPYNIHWSCQVSLDIAQNPKLLDLMAQSGCTGALIGFESLNESNLVLMRKKWNLKYGDYASTLARFYERGIMVYGSFVFGYDYDTTDAFDRTLDFAMRSKLALAQFNPLIPTPSTSLYDRIKKENRLIYDKWWLDDRYRYGEMIFHPACMSAQELAEGCFRLRSEFNAYPSIFRRMLAPQMNARSAYNLFAYLAINLVSRREIFNKQGIPLGDGSSISSLDVNFQNGQYGSNAISMASASIE
jgi:radical SAM superfamily enzyme YgiQ (UPF0313 family)